MSKKRIALLMAVVMVLGVAVGSTMAWLTDKTGDVANTFTVGDINIDLKEHKYDEKEEDLDKTVDPVTSNDNYLFVPGDTLPKDPFVTVKADSEKCYLFVKVETKNNICEVDLNKDQDTLDEGEKVTDIIKWEFKPQIVTSSTASGAETLADDSSNWHAVEGHTGYWYRVVDKLDVDQKWYILKDNQITVDTGVIKEMVPIINKVEGETDNRPQVIVTAAAVQFDNIIEKTADEATRPASAWDKLPAEFKPAP